MLLMGLLLQLPAVLLPSHTHRAGTDFSVARGTSPPPRTISHFLLYVYSSLLSLISYFSFRFFCCYCSLHFFFRTRTAKFSSHFFPPYPKIAKSHTTFTLFFSHHTSRRWSIPIFCAFSSPPPLLFHFIVFSSSFSSAFPIFFFIPLFTRTSFSPSTLSSSFFTCAYPIHNVTAAIIQVWITAGDLCLQI